MLKSMFPSLIARLNSLSVLNDAMSRLLQEQIVLSLCVHLSCFTQQVALFHREHAKHGCFQTVSQVSPIDHRLVWVLIGLVGRTLHVELLHKTVERVYRLAVVQL